jgi:hypothetical protein
LVAGFAAGAELGLAAVAVFFAVVAGRGFLATGDFALVAAPTVAAAATATAATTGTVEPASEPIVAAVDTGLSGWRISAISGAAASPSTCYKKI